MTTPENQMSAIEVARRLAELGEAETAVQVYEAVLTEDGNQPIDRLEAACAVLQYGENYKAAYDTFLDLYCGESELRGDIFGILTDAFYTPNVNKQKNLYRKNCKLLKDYPLIFRKDFLPFEELPVLFYPYDDNGVLPYYKGEDRFSEYTDIRDTQITHYFFGDAENPVLAENIFSQYELEYLNDNVRRSEWVAKENHIYLHYTNWGEFCSYLALLDLKPLLQGQKFVFLIEEEKSLYPIDFKERFGVDYSLCTPKPLHIQEVTRLIWHTQLGSHNGGDFFNEILHGHPYMICDDSLMFYDLLETADIFYKNAKKVINSKGKKSWAPDTLALFDDEVARQISHLRTVTKKDAWVAFYLGGKSRYRRFYHEGYRFVPPIMIQPHFHHAETVWSTHESGQIQIHNNNYHELLDSGILMQFKYIKTFSPLRRPTTSHAATVRFMDRIHAYDKKEDEKKEKKTVPIMGDNLHTVMMNRNMMAAKSDRLYRDSRIVRFEDAKLNPTATFTALARFLDIPYTKTMTYCSNDGGIDPLGISTNVRGFDTATVYRTYDEYTDDNERAFLEYFLRDIYKAYEYDFVTYDGREMTPEEEETLLEKCTTNLDYTVKTHDKYKDILGEVMGVPEEEWDTFAKEHAKETVERSKELRLLLTRLQRYGMNFCNSKGETLHFMKMLEPVPELMEQPLYH